MAFEQNSNLDLQPAPKPGAFGKFYLQELINSGGMADIWLATDQAGATFALRKLKDSLKFNFVDRRRFMRGCVILSQIHNHEQVIKYYEHGKINGSPYCLMEYLESSNLKQMITLGDAVLQEFVGNILIDMAIALEHVHDSGFMHMDFKPENVLVSRSGNIRLVDFDLARPKPEKPEKLSRNPGTPAYMAPEQLRREPLDHRADIFAFGVTAYELLTGQKPFIGDTPDEILRKQLYRGSDFPTPKTLNPDVPPALERSVMKCLERDPDKRHPIMSVLVHELQNALYV
ncbi:MAG: Serine/threonine-protein kinase StkP [Verrucomicrobiales bacterium]|jgi:serine/threonine protein kinase|nr:Serine/threonine-protein kinase StkP [Verrucomicrobiales bacterium]